MLPTTVTGAPKAVPPLKNCTVPVGSCAGFVALLGEFTVAVRVTVPPAATDAELADTVVVVLAFATVTVSVAEVLPVKLLSPE